MTREASISYQSDVPAILQSVDWTCSACALAWLNKSLYIDVATDEWSAVDYIGTPDNINSEWGLMDASGARLASCLTEQAAPAFTSWLPYDAVYHLATHMPLLIGGVTWNHWVGVRYTYGNDLVVVNSAPGWMGIDDRLGESSFNELGPFAVVAVPLYFSFPPPPTDAS